TFLWRTILRDVVPTLPQKWAARKQRRDVGVYTYPEEHDVEERTFQLRAACSKQCVVLTAGLISGQLPTNSMYVGSGNAHSLNERPIRKTKIAVGVTGRDVPLVTPEQADMRPIDATAPLTR